MTASAQYKETGTLFGRPARRFDVVGTGGTHLDAVQVIGQRHVYVRARVHGVDSHVGASGPIAAAVRAASVSLARGEVA